MTSGSPTTPKIENSAEVVRVVEQLRKLADEAHSGPWSNGERGGNGVHTTYGLCIAITHREPVSARCADAAFIAAASPDVVRLLLDDRDADRVKLAALESALADEPHPTGMRAENPSYWEGWEDAIDIYGQLIRAAVGVRQHQGEDAE